MRCRQARVAGRFGIAVSSAAKWSLQWVNGTEQDGEYSQAGSGAASRKADHLDTTSVGSSIEGRTGGTR